MKYIFCCLFKCWVLFLIFFHYANVFKCKNNARKQCMRFLSRLNNIILSLREFILKSGYSRSSSSKISIFQKKEEEFNSPFLLLKKENFDFEVIIVIEECGGGGGGFKEVERFYINILRLARWGVDVEPWAFHSQLCIYSTNMGMEWE